MATTAFTGLLPGSSTPLLASGDVLAFVDISDLTQSAQGSTVKATVTQFFAAIPVPVLVTSTTVPQLAVYATTAAAVLDLTAAGAGATYYGIAKMRSSRGTVAAPTATQNADPLGDVQFYGHTGAAYIATASITAVAVQTFTGTHGGTQLIFKTTPNNSTTATVALTLGTNQEALFSTYLYGTGAQATPGVFAATEFYLACQTVEGATLMGYGTTFDVTLKNRAGTNVLGIGPNTTGVTVTSTLGVGAATPATSGAGMTFPATQSASSDVNTLDDYEEGTWTPVVGGSATYTTQSGHYAKIGRLVHVRCVLTINAIGTGSTTVISGLPFAEGGYGNAPFAIGYFASLATNVLGFGGYIPISSSTAKFVCIVAAGTTATDAPAVLGNGARVEFSATYQTTT